MLYLFGVCLSIVYVMKSHFCSRVARKKNVLSFFFLRTVWVTKWIQQLCDYIIGKPFLFLLVPVCFEMSATNWMRYFVFSAFLKCWCNSINKASPVWLFRRFFGWRCTVPLQYMHIQIHLAQPWSFRPRKPNALRTLGGHRICNNASNSQHTKLNEKTHRRIEKWKKSTVKNEKSAVIRTE